MHDPHRETRRPDEPLWFTGRCDGTSEKHLGEPEG
jgi:hypothetical protein